MSTFSVLAISGSLRRTSLNTALLLAAQRLAPEGLNIEIYDGLGTIPPFNEDIESEPPAAVADLRERIAAADGLLIATPEYNHGVPGVLKNALDWASRPVDPAISYTSRLAGKPVAILGASITLLGAVAAQRQLRQLFFCVDAATVNKPEVIVAHAHEKLDFDGNLRDETTATLVRQALDGLAAKIRATALVSTTA